MPRCVIPGGLSLDQHLALKLRDKDRINQQPTNFTDEKNYDGKDLFQNND